MIPYSMVIHLFTATNYLVENELISINFEIKLLK